jgi:malonyl-CoA O-methyltransferase
MTLSPFSERVRQAFGRRVASYEPLAPLQRGMAWRLAGVAAHHQARAAQALPQGPCADLGAGTGLVGRALAAWRFPLPAPLGQLDLCPESLTCNGSGPTLPWDLNQGLPPHLRGAALLTSSFALQWLEAPTAALAHWGDHLAPGGWLLLGVPTAGSFPEWRQAARRTGLPCSALPLPEAHALLTAASVAGLEVLQAQVLTFSGQRFGSGPRTGSGVGSPPPSHPALGALRALRAIGADATPLGTSLAPGAWRRLLAAWPSGGHLSWEVLLLLARKRSTASPAPGGPP